MLRLSMRIIAVLALPALAAAASSEGGAIVFVADSRSTSGLLAWFTNLYNESLLGFTLLTVAIIPTLGLILGKLTGFVMSRLGIDLKSRVLAEH